MANTWFRFKQFTLQQDKCAMKVTTDACLFGAWAASHMRSPGNVLDIGAGTGLLGMMIAQQHPDAFITAVEIDPDAAVQCAENFANSSWSKILTIRQADIRELKDEVFDTIISNPPFYEMQLPSPRATINTAYHSTMLRLDELIMQANHLLKPGGNLWLLMPAYRQQETLSKLAAVDLHTELITTVMQTPKHEAFRCMIKVQKNRSITPFQKGAILIKSNPTQYSEEFTRLLKPYYLKL